jgi:transposase
MTTKAPAEQVVKDIRRTTHKPDSSKENIRITLSGLRGVDNIAGPCRKEGIAQSQYCGWSKKFLEARKRRSGRGTAWPHPTPSMKLAMPNLF